MVDVEDCMIIILNLVKGNLQMAEIVDKKFFFSQ